MSGDYSKYWKYTSDKFWDKYDSKIFDKYDPETFKPIRVPFDKAKATESYDEYYKRYKKYIKDSYPLVTVPIVEEEKAPPVPKKQRLAKFIIIPAGTTVYAIPRNIEFDTANMPRIITHKKTTSTAVKIKMPSIIGASQETSKEYYYIELNTPNWIAYLVPKRSVTEVEELVDE